MGWSRIVRFFLDENIPTETARMLESLGHDVRTVRVEGLASAADEEVLARGERLGRVLVTLDLDFGRLFVERKPDLTVVLLRPANPRAFAVTELLRGFLAQNDLATPASHGKLFVVRDGGSRARPR